MTHRIARRARTGFGAKTGRNPAAEMAVAGEYLVLPTAVAQLMLGGPWPNLPAISFTARELLMGRVGVSDC